jgi:hypothetical protein
MPFPADRSLPAAREELRGNGVDGRLLSLTVQGLLRRNDADLETSRREGRHWRHEWKD